MKPYVHQYLDVKTYPTCPYVPRVRIQILQVDIKPSGKFRQGWGVNRPPAPHFPLNSELGVDKVKINERVGMNYSSRKVRSVLWPRFHDDRNGGVARSVRPALNREPKVS